MFLWRDSAAGFVSAGLTAGADGLTGRAAAAGSSPRTAGTAANVPQSIPAPSAIGPMWFNINASLDRVPIVESSWDDFALALLLLRYPVRSFEYRCTCPMDCGMKV